MRKLAEERKKWEEEKAAEEKTGQNRECEQKETLAISPTEVTAVLDAMEQKQEQELQELRDEIKMLQTLATTGIVTNMFMHEIRTLTNNIGQELDSAFEAIKFDHDVEYALGNICLLYTSRCV